MHLPDHHGLPNSWVWPAEDRVLSAVQTCLGSWCGQLCARRGAKQQQQVGLSVLCPAQQLLSGPCSQGMPGKPGCAPIQFLQKLCASLITGPVTMQVPGQLSSMPGSWARLLQAWAAAMGLG